MTSVLRRYLQIDPRIKYFTVLADISGYTLDAGSISEPIMDVSGFELAFSRTVAYSSTVLLQDLGRSITVYDPNTTGSPHIALFRQVMLLKGSKIEGISSSISYICTWADTDTNPPIFDPALVARNG